MGKKAGLSVVTNPHQTILMQGQQPVCHLSKIIAKEKELFQLLVRVNVHFANNWGTQPGPTPRAQPKPCCFAYSFHFINEKLLLKSQLVLVLPKINTIFKAVI